jgi:RNA polymerase sigma-70 factor (ECF subfamily)
VFPDGHLRRRLRDPDEAEEVLQRFMLKAIERSADLREVDSVRGWLGRVLATTIIDHQRTVIRRRMREQVTDPDALSKMADLAVTPDAETDQAVCNCLYKLLPTLRAEYAQVIWRADLLDEPRDRIAVSLGTSLNNVTVRLHRARRALKTRLEEMCRTCVVHGFLDCGCEFSVADR